MSKEKTSKASVKAPKKPNALWAALRSERSVFIAGLVELTLACLLGFGYVSFLCGTGKADQALLENMDGLSLSQSGNGVQNWIGTFGAITSEYTINRWLGVAVIFFIILMFRLGYRMMRQESVRPLLGEFVRTSCAVIWLSATLGFFFVSSYESSFLFLGGRHGYDLSQLLMANLGFGGTLAFLLATGIILSIFIFSSTMDKIHALFGWSDRLQERRAKRKAEQERLRAELDAEQAALREEEARLAAEREEQEAREEAERLRREEQERYEAQERMRGEETTPSEALQAAFAEQSTPVSPSETAADSQSDFTPPTSIVEDPDFKVRVLETELVEAPLLLEEGQMPQGDYDPTKDLEFYNFPTFELLKDYPDNNPIDMEEQNANKERIKETLSNYGVEIQSISATVGPTITLFEIVLVSGTKISRVRNLSDEIAMSIASVSGIRIIAPIPGKSAIGIEVPNKDPKVVSMRECIQSRTFQEAKMELPVALGKTIMNEVFVFDLAKAPHLLVAGATGQGKSVGLNAIISSLLYRKHPSQLKIVLVDPKQVEFSIYSRIEKHYLAKLPDEVDPIITDVSRVVSTLQSVCVEMEDRYALVKDAGLRNIKEYNEKFIHRELSPGKLIKAPLGSREGVRHHYLPYIVVIVDEYGDLIMTAGKEIELPIARIAQKARAVGIHMIIATQRPSAKIITGIIKANFPARIAFRVGQTIDSQIILDQPGAQHLIGRGDLLISMGNRFERVQCAFVDTPEVDRVNRWIEGQQSYPTAYILPEPPLGEGGDDGGQGGEVDLRQLDPMFAEAAELVVATGQGSTSMIQRKFSIGYNRAGRIMDQLEAAGIVGPYTGSKARSVLVDSESELQHILSDINQG